MKVKQIFVVFCITVAISAVYIANVQIKEIRNESSFEIAKMLHSFDIKNEANKRSTPEDKYLASWGWDDKNKAWLLQVTKNEKTRRNEK